MMSPVQVLMRAVELGVKLSVEPPDTLTFEPVERCPQDFVEILRDHKPQLMALLRRNDFVLVDSKAVGDLLFFCENESTKAALVPAGAEEWRIYTKDDLRILCEQNRIKPFGHAELQKVHEIKWTFGARINTE